VNAKAPLFVSGLLIGTLASRAAMLLSASHSGKRTPRHNHNGNKGPSTQVDRILARDREELGSWSGEFAAIQETSPKALAQAPMGWY
jgi:gas vesicle protein